MGGRGEEAKIQGGPRDSLTFVAPEQWFIAGPRLCNTGVAATAWTERGAQKKKPHQNWIDYSATVPSPHNNTCNTIYLEHNHNILLYLIAASPIQSNRPSETEPGPTNPVGNWVGSYHSPCRRSGVSLNLTRFQSFDLLVI